MSRRWLLAMTIGGQAVLLAVGWALTFGVTRSEMASQLHEQILESNRRTVALLGDQLRASDGEFEYGSAQWEVAQGLIEGLSLPGGGVRVHHRRAWADAVPPGPAARPIAAGGPPW